MIKKIIINSAIFKYPAKIPIDPSAIYIKFLYDTVHHIPNVIYSILPIFVFSLLIGPLIILDRTGQALHILK